MSTTTVHRTESASRPHDDPPDGLGAPWPPHVSTNDSDVVVAGISMRCLVDWAGTPCVHNCDPAPVPPQPLGDWRVGSLIVTRVLAVTLSTEGAVHVTIDAELGGCRPIFTEARLIGRASECSRFEMLVGGPLPDALSYVVRNLPADIAVGDLILFPCVGITVLHDIRISGAS